MATVAEALAIAVQHHRAGRLPEAEGIYRQVLDVEPDHPDALHLLGVVAQAAGRHDIACDLITAALAARRDFPDASYNLGITLEALGRPEEAIVRYDTALAARPAWAEAHNNRANALKSLGRLDEAVDGYRRAVAARPDYARAHGNLGVALAGLGRLDEAMACYRAALALDPEFAEAHNNLAKALKELGRLDEAVDSYRRAAALRPQSAEIHANLGNALRELDRIGEAIACYEQAIARKPDYAEAYNGLGLALCATGDYRRAAERVRFAISLQPDLADAHNNLGNIEKINGRIDRALECYDTALAIRPDKADAHVNRAYSLFIEGRLGEAWAEHEWRWKGVKPPRPFPQPWWNGTSLAGRTLLVWGEQGLADEILSVGMAPEVTGGPCIWECDPRLVALFARSFPSVSFVPRRDPPVEQTSAAQVQIAAFSLARYFRNDAADFPRRRAYLSPDPNRAARWREWLDGLGPGLKVGISWRGRLVNSARSHHFPSLAQSGVILGIPGLVFVTLQYDDGAADIATLREHTGVHIHTPPGIDLTNDLDDLAALMAGLDAAVGPATAVGDLAGAVGCPTWMYAYYPVSNEKEICNFDHIPWCPSIRVETRAVDEDWDGVLSRIVAGLRARAIG